jgi:hypothetical protein
MDNNLRKQIYGNMSLIETDELVKIWQENDQKEWTDLAFNVIREILINRLGELPIRTGQVEKKELSTFETTLKYPRNKILLLTQYSYIGLFALFLLSKALLPDTGGGWSEPPIFDFLFFFSSGVCLTFSCIILTYYSWTLNAKEFSEWTISQLIIGKEWRRKYGNPFPDWYVLWSNRILDPVGILFGIVVVSFVVIGFLLSFH